MSVPTSKPLTLMIQVNYGDGDALCQRPVYTLVQESAKLTGPGISKNKGSSITSVN